MGMKMARARKEEIEKATILAGMLDDLDDGSYPRWINGEFLEDEPAHFDEDDFDHLRALYDRLMKMGGLWRVSLGYAVLTDPANKVINPDLSHLELHPRLLEGRRAVDSPFSFWFERLVWRHIEAVKNAWSEDVEAVRV